MQSNAANAGGLKLTPLEQHAGVNTGGSNVLQLTPELAAVPQPLVDAKLSPRDQLKATLRKIIKDASSSWTTDQIGQFNEGYVEGFRAGAKNTLDFIRSLDSQVASATVSVLNGAVWLLKGAGDMVGSMLFKTPRSPDLDPNVVARCASQNRQRRCQCAKRRPSAQRPHIDGRGVWRDLSASGFSAGSRHPVAGRPLIVSLGFASPITIAVLQTLAEAVADLSPRKRATYLGWSSSKSRKSS